jgi:hypothetical protein
MNDNEWEQMKQVLETDRGVSRPVAEERGYAPYDKGDTARVYALAPRLLKIPEKQRRAVHDRAIRAEGGIIMPKHPVPGAPPVLPQLRPDHAVLTNPLERAQHDHAVRYAGDPDALTAHVDGTMHRGDAPSGMHAHHDHRFYGPGALRRHLIGKRHEVSADTVIVGPHLHDPDGYAKYIFCPKRWVDVNYTCKEDPCSQGGGPSKHMHTKRRKEKQSPEKRLDLHPRSLGMLPDAEVVFFSIEGSIKADAILSAGGCSFAVPSVGMWSAPELEDFARGYLSGKRVVVVPDADWAVNPMVSVQAFSCAMALNRWGAIAAVGASPREKGIDDYLAAGGTLGEMKIEVRRERDEFRRWADMAKRSQLYDADVRNRRAIVNIARFFAMTCTEQGEVSQPGRTVCHAIPELGSAPRLRRMLWRAKLLQEADIELPFTIEEFAEDNDQWTGWVTGGLAWWEKAPVFEIREQYRPESSPLILGEWLS